MDAWALNLKGFNGGGLCTARSYPLVHASSKIEKPNFCNFGKNGFGGSEESGFHGGFSEIRAIPLRSKQRKSIKMERRSSSLGSSGRSIPEEDGQEGSKDDSGKTQPDDWRTFRANLVAREQIPAEEAGPSKPLGSKWAHPIPSPEPGCVLVATEKLDGARSFERAVVLLLRVGSPSDPREGPFGVVINRPLRKTIKDMKPSNPDLATTFSDCSLHFGGPLEASMFLATGGEHLLAAGFERVIPGLWYGARHNLKKAADLVRRGVLDAKDFRFFLGYSGWQFEQLKEEIELDYWHVAACSSNLVTGTSDSLFGLWEEILQLMGGQYSELSRKPKKDNT
ncbi:hypothetical protein AMTRI_Chr11g101450 [Amborella trichopoda]|uniref:uncharacterized protein LOC18427691 n=1 Tax=Amborella trichopoda TaxID=13333 RepID=UPI0005D442EB|nr:uncharacterized protein LOC18427691 [Amborella trichopoda]|eukprot:XP_011620962.1 uncharacterized protein LOC18427691 [Amborella trichopoda]